VENVHQPTRRAGAIKGNAMNTEPLVAAPEGRWKIEVSDLSLVFQEVDLPSGHARGADLANAAGISPESATVLHLLANGELEDIRPSELVDLSASTRKFVVVASDRIYHAELDGHRIEWPARVISGGQLRRLGSVPEDHEIYLDLGNGTERLVEPQALVDLGGTGTEKFQSRKKHWKLNVQGVVLTLHEPTVVVRQALELAGFDPSKNWLIFLRVRGQPKREVGLDDVADLRMPGIEKLRLTPREVNNGEALRQKRRQFRLLDVDETFLDGLGLDWETVIDQERRWLLIYEYPIPRGFTARLTTLALEIPLTYPGAQIDMFYTSPRLALASGRAIDRTQVSATILGTGFNGWSRHRGAQSPWNPESDNVKTHLALVESAISKEVEE
jgi:hypothetical protein